MSILHIPAESVRTAFQTVGRRHLFLSGSRGCGKTTLLRALTRDSLPGITTWAEPRRAVYMRDNTSGETVQIGIYDESLPGTENKMRPLTENIDTVGVQFLNRCTEAEGEWVSIDEIGYLEADCAAYTAALNKLMKKKRLIAAVREQSIPFLDAFRWREDVFLLNTDRPYGEIGCVIMASGLGRRFGGNKLMADLHGKPLIQHVLCATENIFSVRIVVTRHSDVADLCRAAGVAVIVHDLPDRNDTVRIGLSGMENTSGCIFFQGDQPLLRRETAAAMAIAAVKEPHLIWRAAHGEEMGAPVCFPASLYDELRNLPRGKGGGFCAAQHAELIRGIQVQNACEMLDADTPETLEKLRNIFL